MPYIYKITNNINGKLYIGKTNRTVEQRWKEHCKDYKRRSFEKRPLYRAINKYGIENFSIEEIEKVKTDEEACEREKYWIEYFGSFKNGYNATMGGDGTTYIDRDLVIQYYNQYKKCTLVAEKMGISPDTVSKILKDNSIEIITGQIHNKIEKGKIVYRHDKTSDELLQIHSSITAAAQWLIDNNFCSGDIKGITSHIRQVCNNKRKTAYGFKWTFKK